MRGENPNHPRMVMLQTLRHKMRPVHRIRGRFPYVGQHLQPRESTWGAGVADKHTTLPMEVLILLQSKKNGNVAHQPQPGYLPTLYVLRCSTDMQLGHRGLCKASIRSAEALVSRRSSLLQCHNRSYELVGCRVTRMFGCQNITSSLAYMPLVCP
jgi:hypothetical protein